MLATAFSMAVKGLRKASDKPGLKIVETMLDLLKTTLSE
jgi:hypothetical protein